MLLDDGKFKLRIVEASDVRIDAEVLTNGVLGSRKGISLPDTVLPFGAMTEKDRADVDFAMSLGVAWIALSFVQRGEDIAEARKLARGRSSILAKIEKPSALNHLDEIIDLADAIMVARGDLGVEMPVEKVPGLQKQITRAARNAGKPVVVATQMLESMIYTQAPTRAEVSDVATAVFDGADAVMLSAESAVGKYPVEAVATMDRVAIEVERDPLYEAIIHAQRIGPGRPRRRDLRRRPHHGRDAQPCGDRLLHGLGRDQPPRRPRTPPAADHRSTPIPHRAQARAGLGTARSDRRPHDLTTVAKACHIAYRKVSFCPAHYLGRCAARHARRHHMLHSSSERARTS
jgi:hypothetical protein